MQNADFCTRTFNKDNHELKVNIYYGTVSTLLQVADKAGCNRIWGQKRE